MSKKQAQPSFGYFKAAKLPKHGAEFPHINADTYANRPHLGWIRDREVPEQQALLTMKHTTKGCIEVRRFSPRQAAGHGYRVAKNQVARGALGRSSGGVANPGTDSAEQLVAWRRSANWKKPLKSTSA
ncbi:MAG: hypothetical protein R2857_00745 [Vampirovibrionales bacterium]